MNFSETIMQASKRAWVDDNRWYCTEIGNEELTEREILGKGFRFNI